MCYLTSWTLIIKMMQSIKGVFKDGVVHPSEPNFLSRVSPVGYYFLMQSSKTVELSEEKNRAGWDKLFSAIENCQMETGISDLADQHDY